ncbi:MAG TPA: phage head closure protein [Thauera aminoaromatica]|nr:phage head closure protein [Thauera aminoaromatica]
MGRLRHRIRLQRRVESQGPTGEVTWSWTDVAEVWASIEPIAGREYFAAAQVQSEVTTRIRLRHRPDLTAKLRVVFVSEPGSPGLVHVYDVLSVINWQERDREVHLMCRLKPAEGFAYDGNA